jgi:catechol 2,3-dioxygenase
MTEMDSIMDKTLVLDAVELTVADLDRSVEYHTQDIGLRLLARDTGSARLGVPGRAFVVLRQLPGALPPPSSSAGLSHFAPQVPTPADLARFVRHYARYARFQLIDHVVSRSCYVLDPDGHCVEVTCTRPRNEWRWQNGRPVLVADPLEMQDFSGEPGADLPFDSLPPDTELGHVQLKLTDPGLAATEPFYCDLLGFEVEARLGTMFLAVGVATNRFSPAGGEPAPEDSARLLGVDLVRPAPDDAHELAGRLSAGSQRGSGV